ncbi:MAG: hypothetical protein Q9169_005509 [Polycauliona sp. 2 TL-2023]
MANSLVKCLDRMLALATKSQSGMRKICQPVAGEAGTRCYPADVHDSKIGGRLDYGDLTDGGKKRRLKCQVDKNAETKTLKDMAAKDSHKVHATVDVDVGLEATVENAEKIFEELKESVKGRFWGYMKRRLLSDLIT